MKTENRKGKLINCISFATIFAAFILLVIGIYWMSYPYKPMTIDKRPLPVVNKQVTQGEFLYYVLDYCKNMQLPVTISRRFTDGIVYSMPDVSADNAVGCREQTIAVEIPKGLPEGEYILTITYSYEVNPIRKVDVKTHTEKFTVVK